MKNKFVWYEGDIQVMKRGNKPDKQDLEERCSRCGIPIFMALKFHVIKGKDVCEACLTKTEERKILRERYKKLGLDDSELKGK